MGSIKIKSLSSATSVLSSQRGKPLINKRLELGNEYILLFPKKDNEIVVSGIPGYNCSYDDVGISFVRLTSEEMEVDEDTQRIIDKSGVRSWSMVSDILYEAARARDIEKATDEARRMAERTNTSFESQTVALNQAIEKINQAYDGVRGNSTTPGVPPTKTRLVSRGLTISIFTNAVLIPLNKELKPIYDKACAVEVRLSNTKINQLTSIQDSPAYNDKNDPDGFVEVKFAYKGTSRNEAGKQSYQGCESNVRKINLTRGADGAFLDADVENIASIINSVSHDADTIYNSSNTVAYASSSVDLDFAMRKFLAYETTLTSYIDMESDNIKKVAELLLSSGTFREESTQYKQLKEMVKADVPVDVEDNILPDGIKEVVGSKTVGDVNKATEDYKELEELIKEEVTDI